MLDLIEAQDSRVLRYFSDADNNIIDSTLQLSMKDRIVLKRPILRNIYAQALNRKEYFELTFLQNFS